MADDLDPVTQEFLADMTPYIDAVRGAVDDARNFADANLAAASAVDDMSNHANSAGRAATELRDHVDSATQADRSLRDSAIEAAGGLDRLRDKALETAEAEKRLDDRSVSLREKLTRVGATAAVITGLGDVFSVFSKDASMSSRILSGFSLATGLLEAPVATAAFAVGGLTSGLVTAGIGLGAFGLVAKSAISSVTPAVQAYETALNTSGKAAKTAMTQYQQYMAALAPGQREMARSLISAEGEWNKFVQANTAGVSKIVSQGIGLLPGILRTIQPMLAPVESALSGVIKMISSDMKSSGFITFMAGIDAYAGPAITKIAKAINNIVSGIAGVIQAFMPFQGTVLGGLDKMTAAFAHWGQTLTTHSGFQSLVQMAKADGPLLGQVLKNLAAAFLHLGSSMTGLSTFSNSKMLLQLAVPISKLLDDLTKANPAMVRFGLYVLAAGGAFKKLFGENSMIRQGVSGIQDAAKAAKDLHAGFTDADQAASDATGVWGTFGGKLSSLGEFARTAATKMGLLRTATRDGTIAQEGMDVALEANPIGIIITAVVALIAIIVLLTMHSKAFREFWKAAWGDIEAVAVAAWHFIDRNMIQPLTHGVAQLVDWVRSHWKLLATIIATVLLGPIGGLIVFVATHWQMIRTDTSRLISDVTSFFRSLPGKILSALGDLGRILFNAGASIIDGLINGLKSALGSLGSFLGSVGSFIASHKGPIDVDRVLLVPHGKAIIQGLMDGMNSRKTELQSMLTGLTGSVAGSAAQGLAAAGVGSTSAPAVHVTVPVALGAGTTGYNSPQFLQYLQGVVQEGVLRYTQVNPSNGLSVAGKLS